MTWYFNRTTDDELNALFEEIGKEIDMDPEMSQDLLEFLNSEEEEDEDDYEEPMEVVEAESSLVVVETEVSMELTEEHIVEQEVQQEEYVDQARWVAFEVWRAIHFSF